jgi:outer membrane usher protein
MPTQPAPTRLTLRVAAALFSWIANAAYADVAAPSIEPSGKAAAAEEMWLAVALNGQPTGTTALVRYDHAGNIWVGAEELRTWRLPLPGQSDDSVPGTPMYPLAAFPGMVFRVDETSQTLAVEAPARLFDAVQIGGSTRDFAPAPAPPPGGFFNYDVVAMTTSLGLGANALLEAGAFGRAGTAITRFVERKQSTGSQSVRLDSTWTLDRPASVATLRLGDSITGSSRWWGGAARFGGLQWASNFATQPGLITIPLPSVGGESALPSTLELYVNDALRMRQELPGGPFNVRDVPIVNGDGQIRVVVRDMLGREQVITQSYYSSPRLLRPGLHDYSIEAGAIRENFGLASNDYGRPIVSATERYGFTSRFTGEAHAEILENQQTAGFAAGLLVPMIGVVSTAIAGSSGTAGTGTLASLGIERSASRMSFGLNARVTSEAFRHVGLVNEERLPRFTGQLYANISFGRAGSLSLMDTRQTFHNNTSADIVSIRQNISLRGFGYVTLSALRVTSADTDTAFGISFARSLGRRTSADFSVVSEEAGASGYMQMQRSLPAGDGFGYRVRARAGATQAGEGAVSYQNDVGTYALEAEQVNDVTQTRASAAGGVAFMRAGLFASRRIDSSFAIARVGEQADVRIYHDNQLVGRTNADGYAILPGLRAYEDNQISIEQADLPLDMSVGALRMKAVPAYRSGMLLTFPVERTHGALLTVQLENGEPLPPGATVRFSDSSEDFPTGMRGEVYVSRLADRNRMRATWPEGTCEFDVAFTPSSDPLPRLGPFECRDSSK